MRRLIAISGKRFSGKDTFAALLRQKAQERGVDVATYAFAGESKRLFAAAERARGVEVDVDRLKVIAEYICFDSNRAVDSGWLEPLS